MCSTIFYGHSRLSDLDLDIKMTQHIYAITNAYTPKETVELCGRAGVSKANMRWDKIFISSVLAGMLLSFACAVLLSTNSAPWCQEYAPGLIRTIAALVFPFGLTMVIVTGTDLCTGSFMITTISVLQRRLSIWKMLLHWTITFFGNLAGSLFLVAIITGYGGVFDTEPYQAEVITFNMKKVVTPQWHMIFLRGISANWLVCMACFLAFMAREYFSKVMAIWWPTFAFVALGLDHVVANMFFVPMAIWQNDSQITVGLYIWKSMIPALIGNIIGGALFVAAAFWYLHLSSEDAVPVDGVFYASDRKPLVGSEVDSPQRDQSEERKKSAEAMV
ncbi:putative formate transporter [Pseudocercospora fuligena]|uniref:Putative formate transporter n=1 Tax=Pseudocercospora fuligena TaxID=685502 RepID=A0A8H6RS01_9PEZI|nr:putative formate transporter [Pseudocercospora fuligena]